MPSADLPTTTADALARRLASDRPPWLVFAPDRVSVAAGHVPGSLALPSTEVLLALVGGAEVVVYGEDGSAGTARRVTSMLLDAGVDACLLAGGLRAWEAGGHPVQGSGS